MIVDFLHVPSNQTEIHERLENWAMWCKTHRSGGMLSMFRGYRPYLYPERGPSPNIDSRGAIEVQQTMAHIPEKNRLAIQWFYMFRNNPNRMCAALGVTKQTLADLVIDGRTMIKNRLTVNKNMCIKTGNVSVYA